MTATQLIYRACRALGYLRQGGGLSAEILNDGLDLLNEMIEEFLIDRLKVYSIDGTGIFNLTAGTLTYTIGPTGANFTAPRPERIEAANILLNSGSNTLRFPLKILRDAGEWANIRLKNLSGSIPQYLYYDRAFPNGNITLWIGPNQSFQIELFTWLQLTNFASLTVDHTFPPGYAGMLRWNLAKRLMPLMPSAADRAEAEARMPHVMDEAAQAVAKVEAHNAPELRMRVDQAVMGRAGGYFNYLDGSVGRNY